MEGTIIWTVLVVSNKITEDEGFVHAYTMQSSNKEKVIEYAKTIKKQPSKKDCKVYVVEKNKAKEKVKAWKKWLKDIENAKLERYNKKMDKLSYRQVAKENFEK